MEIIAMLISVLCLIGGAGMGYFLRNRSVVAELKERKEKGDKLIERAKEQANDIKYWARKEAKEIAREEKKRHEGEMINREKKIKAQEREMVQAEARFEGQKEDFKNQKEKLRGQETKLEERLQKVDKEIGIYHNKQNQLANKLSEVAAMTKDEARAELISTMEESVRVDFAKVARRIEEETKRKRKPVPRD